MEIFAAIRSHDIGYVRRALGEHLPLDVHDLNGYTPLLLAVEQGFDAAVAELLEWGADPNQENKRGRMPLFLAVLQDNLLVAELLCRHHADTNYPETPSLLFVQSAEMVDLLICFDADISVRNNVGMNVVHCVTVRPNVGSILPCLLKHGADINAREFDGESPLMYACMDAGSEVACAELLDHGAEWSPDDKYYTERLVSCLKYVGRYDLIKKLRSR